jgi:hypothetical protein
MVLDAGVLLVLGLNGLAWVWGAGRLMRSVESLEKTSAKLEEAVEKLSGMLGEHAERLAALEAINNHRRFND